MPETNCVADQPGNMTIDFGQARDYTDASMLIPSWHRHARFALERGDLFEAFIFDWIAFNGWAERVTDAEKDTDWIDALAASDELRSCFTRLLTDERYASACRQFAALWPIFRADQQRRRLRIAANTSRADVVHASLAAGIRHRPRCFRYHDGRVPIDWPHVLHALYQVRCSLFHGEKLKQSDSDRSIVMAAAAVLDGFMTGSGYFDWA
jgi:hypothetical protein